MIQKLNFGKVNILFVKCAAAQQTAVLVDKEKYVM